MTLFLVGRAVRGVAGAGITVMALTALVVLFAEDERPRAVGIYQAANFVALPLGPLVGGWMLAHLWWGWVFLINVPVVVVALVGASVLVPESRASERPGLDPVGTTSCAGGLVLTIGGTIRAGTGLALAASTSAAIATLDAERSGVGAAVVQAFNKASGPFGAAVFGSVLVAVYRGHDLPDGARRGLTEGLLVAAEPARAAFVAGFRVSLLVSAGVAVVGAVAAAALLPGRQDLVHG
ncbi:MFS transporter [Cryptosporangium japonicum]|uniref:Major facilitator superfamily (MFS) profile domain-containing protein n=1 Tax=Cryptosporangium japonicum TaxID=80872 RepID=A0ABP3DMH2_9ACTN